MVEALGGHGLFGVEFFIRGVGFIKTVADLEKIVIRQEGGTPIQVKHVASVSLGPEFRRGALDNFVPFAAQPVALNFDVKPITAEDVFQVLQRTGQQLLLRDRPEIVRLESGAAPEKGVELLANGDAEFTMPNGNVITRAVGVLPNVKVDTLAFEVDARAGKHSHSAGMRIIDWATARSSSSRPTKTSRTRGSTGGGHRNGSSFESVFINAARRPIALVDTAVLNFLREREVVDGDRVLVTGQTAAKENGIYVVSTGAWTRAKDYRAENSAQLGTTVLAASGTSDSGELLALERPCSVMLTGALVPEVTGIVPLPSGRTRS